MPRSRGDKEYILPIQGLNTEANLLHFPQEFSPDVLNMEPDYNPQVIRPRKGIRTSLLPRLAETRDASDHDVAISSYLWESANNDPDTNLVIVQVGRYLYFFNDTGVDDPTASVINGRIDLNNSLSGTAKGTVTGQGSSNFTKEHKVTSSGEYSFSGCVFTNTVEVSGKAVYTSCR